jgi:hypothetical protein
MRDRSTTILDEIHNNHSFPSLTINLLWRPVVDGGEQAVTYGMAWSINMSSCDFEIQA